VDHGFFSSIHDIENLMIFLPKFIQIYTRKTRLSKFSQIIGKKMTKFVVKKALM